MTRAYCRCNSGHYFVGEFCPLDGWSSSESTELKKVVEQVVGTGEEPSLVRLRAAGLSDSALRRTIVIEFGIDECAFDAISPEGYFVDGHWIKQRDFDQRFI